MSTLFNLRARGKEITFSNHPWEKTIKSLYTNQIKYAHNSIKNPQYPKAKAIFPDKDCIKFTVIGDRVSKEFIYCATLVKGLHKYRWKKFDVPVVRGVTTIEWPEVWRHLKIQYGGVAHCIQSSVIVLMNDNILGGEKELKELVESKYVYHLTLDYYNEAIKEFALFIRSSGRPCAYMHVSINEEPIGTLIFMLYSDIAPNTCENFLRLCKETKGGYSGTPVHRIVKDGWIQCGGFGLKSSDLDCENFIIPHDRRGLLCMANDGRHVDCSTQFFVLLQPAPWMAHKYVAFGQLIEGEATLDKIEKVPTWYEAPSSKIIIYKAGILNLECQDITINKGTNAYIDGHIEDLNALEELLMETLITRVFLEIELKLVEKLEKELEAEEEIQPEGSELEIHATKRFIQKKEDIDKQLQGQPNVRQSIKSQGDKTDDNKENNDFDVEEYELEESTYQHQSLVTSSVVVKPVKPFYIPLTDVPYPGEVDSTYDLKKFLKGDYCLESDLDHERPKNPSKVKNISYPCDLVTLCRDDSDSESYVSLESEEEREIHQYIQMDEKYKNKTIPICSAGLRSVISDIVRPRRLVINDMIRNKRMNVDHVSFSGDIIKHIGRGQAQNNLPENVKRSQLISDDALRRIRLASVDLKSQDPQNKKVSISVPNTNKNFHSKIKRRQTGFILSEDLANVQKLSKSIGTLKNVDDETPKSVRIAPSAITSGNLWRSSGRPTGMLNHQISDEGLSDVDKEETLRPSVLHRLYDDVSNMDSNGPTLKDFRPLSEMQQKNMLLITSPNYRIKSDDSTKEQFLKYSMSKPEPSFEHALNLQHNKKLARKISSDYVKAMSQMGHKFENSIRSIEYAKTRPSLTVSAYQLKNLKYQEEMRNKIPIKKANELHKNNGPVRGIRLPGDTPLYSVTSDEIEKGL